MKIPSATGRIEWLVNTGQRMKTADGKKQDNLVFGDNYLER